MRVSDKQLLPLTGIRFFLALWVICFHQAQPNGYLREALARLPNVIGDCFQTGYMAVGVFFILSGFVLSYSYDLAGAWPPSRLAQFAVARFARIYPVYCLGLVIVAPMVISGHYTGVRVVKDTVVAFLNLTLLQAWIPKLALSWNPPGWSLSGEAFFYCCFPLIGAALWRLSRWRTLAIAAILLWIASVIVPLLAFIGLGPEGILGNQFWTNLLAFNPLLRLPDFLLGIVLCRVFHEARGSLEGRGYWLYLPGLVLELVAIAYGGFVPLPLRSGLFLPIHCLAILGLALDGGSLARLLSTRPIVFLGQVSYSMYILHMPLMMWMNRALDKPTMSVYLVTVIGLSALVFKVRPSRASRAPVW